MTATVDAMSIPPKQKSALRSQDSAHAPAAQAASSDANAGSDGSSWSSGHGCLGCGIAAVEPIPGEGDQPTTIMLQRIPDTMTENDVRRTLDELGFQGRYDAVYVPMKMAPRNRNLSYAFVNFLDAHDVVACFERCAGKPFGNADSTRLCRINYAYIQGAEYTRSRPDERLAKGRRMPRRQKRGPRKAQEPK